MMKSEVNKIDAAWNTWFDQNTSDLRFVPHIDSFYAGYEAAEIETDAKIAELQSKLATTKKALTAIVNADYRGNRPPASFVAKAALDAVDAE